MVARGSAGPEARILFLSSADLKAALTPKAALAALARAYAKAALAPPARALAFELPGGSLHIKAAIAPHAPQAFAAKLNVNLPGNPARGRPTIQGLLTLVDTKTGRPLAVMESRALTGIRTAATAVFAAGFAAPERPNAIAVIGCGEQAGYVAAAFGGRYPKAPFRLYDRAPARARALARRLAAASVAGSAGEAAEGADICVTCTTASAPVLDRTGDLRFVAALGADNPKKRKLDDALMRRASIVADDVEACLKGGEVSHVAGIARPVSLAELAAGGRIARAAPGRPVVYDSTGSGLQDAAAAWAAYLAARRTGAGTALRLF
jgi:ornithine cyclodeaminase/alanine dehydrogenase-like protein (mu-crystallin family)